MSKKNSKRQQQRIPPHKNSSPQQSATATVHASVDRLEAEASARGLTLGAGEEAARSEVAVAGVADSEASLRSRLETLIDAYTRGKEDVDKRDWSLAQREEELKAQSAELEGARKSLDDSRSAMEEETSRLAAARAEADARLAALVEREEELIAREADADAGFITRREQMLGELQRAHDGLLERNRTLHQEAAEREQEHLERLAEQQADHERRLEEMRQEAEAECRSRQDEIRSAEEAVRTREREVANRLFDAEEARRDAETLKEHVDEYIEERTEERVADVRRQLESAKRDGEALRSRLADLEQVLAERNAAVRVLENMSPEAVRRKIDDLQRRIGELQNDLADRPSKAEAAELRSLREEQARWEQDRQALAAEKGRLDSRLQRLMIEVDEVESLRDRNKALAASHELLKAAVDDLRSDLDERLNKHRDQPVFPEMLRMDEDPGLGQAPSRLFRGEDGLDLQEFADDLRHRVGFDPEGERPELYYREEDIRAFLGGLAMSRLHIIQGISGIGKSSLPRVFAHAVGGFCQNVPVQAGWRDRNDLFGYFNAFERRYYELPITQALYRAATPQWHDRVAIILLDEMNLSYAEQYAADVLDVLERQDGAERRFELLSFTPPGKSPALVVDGRYLPLPKNVWFIGTANHDETTKDFADKTYDRSFVLELPGRPTRFELKRVPRREPVSYEALADAFDRAAREHAKVATKAVEWTQAHLRGPMDERFRAGWGGRLESQVRRFVPVVVAAGGGLGEALDQLIATRVLRKIKGRHDNIEDDLQYLVDVLEKTWPDKSHEPVAARHLIEDELRHLRG